jgi:hypothetical protein
MILKILSPRVYVKPLQGGLDFEVVLEDSELCKNIRQRRPLKKVCQNQNEIIYLKSDTLYVNACLVKLVILLVKRSIPIHIMFDAYFK